MNEYPYTPKQWYEGLLQENEAIESDFYDLTMAHIGALCHRQGINEEIAEEIFIYSYTECLANIKNQHYEFRGYKPSSYAYKIAYYRILKWKEKHGFPFVESKEDKLIIDEAREDPFVEYSEIGEEFLKSFDSLCQVCQDLIKAYYEEGLKDDEIAKDPRFLDYTSRGGVNRKKKQCVKKLREDLEKKSIYLPRLPKKNEPTQG